MILGDFTGFQPHRMAVTARSTQFWERDWIRDSRSKLKEFVQ